MNDPMRQIAMGCKPDPYNFKIVKIEQLKNYTIVEANYDGCLSFDGNKLMLIKGIYKSFEALDPHFLNEEYPVIARFQPTEIGWDMAIASAEFLDSITPINTKELIRFAETIKHCMDYGQLFVNQDEKKVCWVSGGADFDEEEVEAGACTGYDDIVAGFYAVKGVEDVEIMCEYGYDETEGWELLGQFGIDNYHLTKRLLDAKLALLKDRYNRATDPLKTRLGYD